MFDQFLEEYRKRAVEATTQLQQEMLRYWTQQWPGLLSGLAAPAAPAHWMTQVHDAQRKWAETVTDMLNKHRETLDAQYRAGIDILEEAFRVGEARDPEQFRRLAETLWRHYIDSLKAFVEAQSRDIQSAMQKCLEVSSQGVAAITKK
jgi:hypothetical protein